MIGIKSKGSFDKTDRFLSYISSRRHFSNLDHYGKMGVDALASSTPVESGLTAASWKYKITSDKKGIRIEWFNTNIVDGVNISIILQYGHGTGTGGFVYGYDYINPAMRPIFDAIANDVWKKVKNA